MKMLVFVVSIAFVTQGIAQSEFSISTGMSFPSGDFGASSGGAAKIGLMGDVLYQHQVHAKSNLWLAGMVRFQSHKVDIAEFEKAFPGMQIAITNWDSFSFLAGPVLRIALSETTSLEPRLCFGYLLAKSPSVTITSGGQSAAVNSDDAGAFAIMFGAVCKFRVSNKVSFVGGVDYSTANPRFNISTSLGAGAASIDSNQQISAFNAIIGLCFKLK